MNGTSMYSGFWRRVVAAILDGLIIGAVTAPFTVGMRDGNRYSATASSISIVVWWLYEALLESSAKQATVGKMALGIRVTDLDGNRIGFGKATGRHFAKYLSALILGIGYLMAAFTERKQALHDILAGTLVLLGAAIPASAATPPPPPPRGRGGDGGPAVRGAPGAGRRAEHRRDERDRRARLAGDHLCDGGQTIQLDRSPDLR